MLALYQHNTLAYYAFYYTGIFDAGLVCTPFYINVTVMVYRLYIISSIMAWYMYEVSACCNFTKL